MVEYKINNNIAHYEIYEDGYLIRFDNEKLEIEQREPLIPVRHLSYEENAIRQIEEQFAVFDSQNKPTEQDDINSMLVDLEYELTLLKLGL